MSGMDGILAVYKPVGITSFDVIRAFKRSVHPTYKIGHAGTLDPFAEGVMLLMLGIGTKQFDQLQKLPKTYLATARLGASSDTLDVTGTIAEADKNIEYRKISVEQIEKVAEKFVGEITQKIPDYSAAKIHGQPRYMLARRGEEVPAKSKIVTIYSIEIISLLDDLCVMRVGCSSGTYIRQLSYDIFHTLGLESYLEKLHRESIGHNTEAMCARLENFSDSTWQDMVVMP